MALFVSLKEASVSLYFDDNSPLAQPRDEINVPTMNTSQHGSESEASQVFLPEPAHQRYSHGKPISALNLIYAFECTGVCSSLPS